MIRIDGSFGEGGGQVLRTSLSLSLVTGQPFRIDNIRAGREKPGLLRQHLTAVLAAAEVGGATVDGATLGSTALSFSPGKLKPGEYRFAVGTAGSGTLVFQTILPALMLLRAEQDHNRRRNAQLRGSAVRLSGSHVRSAGRTYGTENSIAIRALRILSGRRRTFLCRD